MRPIDRTRDTPWMWWCGPIRLNLLIRLGVFSPHPTWVTGGGRNQSGARFGRQLPPPDATPLPYRRPRTTCRPVRRQGIAVAVPRTRRSIATVRAGDNRQPLWRQPIERWSHSSRCAELIPAGRTQGGWEYRLSLPIQRSAGSTSRTGRLTEFPRLCPASSNKDRSASLSQRSKSQARH